MDLESNLSAIDDRVTELEGRVDEAEEPDRFGRPSDELRAAARLTFGALRHLGGDLLIGLGRIVAGRAETIGPPWSWDSPAFGDTSSEVPSEEIPMPPDPYEHFTPRQRIIARTISRFIADNFAFPQWLGDQTITRVEEHADGTTDYVLPVPNNIRLGKILVLAPDLARALLSEESDVELVAAPRYGGVFIRFHNREITRRAADDLNDVHHLDGGADPGDIPL
jgi:hypothetical protein